ncbi:MAG: hypothetical protein ABIX37_10120 [Gammaproteobacteria bacterium]
MQIRDTLLGLCLGFATATVAAPATSNWLNEAVLVRLPQSEIVRHPIDNGKYYLCWTDGVNRYGVAFRRSQLDSKIRSIPRAGRASVATLMLAPGIDAPPITPWQASDYKVCWPK